MRPPDLRLNLWSLRQAEGEGSLMGSAFQFHRRAAHTLSGSKPKMAKIEVDEIGQIANPRWDGPVELILAQVDLREVGVPGEP